MKKALFFIALINIWPSYVSANGLNTLIEQSSMKRNVNANILRAIIETESHGHPWTLNIDGEGFKFKSKDAAVSALWNLTKNQYLLKVNGLGSGRDLRIFFPNQSSASAYVRSLIISDRTGVYSKLTQRTDQSKVLQESQYRIRKIWLINTDIGIAQINYRFNGRGIASVQKWLDPSFNIDYAARKIAEIKKSRNVSDFEAAGFYHSATPALRSRYLSEIKKFLERNSTSATNNIASN